MGRPYPIKRLYPASRPVPLIKKKLVPPRKNLYGRPWVPTCPAGQVNKTNTDKYKKDNMEEYLLYCHFINYYSSEFLKFLKSIFVNSLCNQWDGVFSQIRQLGAIHILRHPGFGWGEGVSQSMKHYDKKCFITMKGLVKIFVVSVYWKVATRNNRVHWKLATRKNIVHWKI